MDDAKITIDTTGQTTVLSDQDSQWRSNFRTDNRAAVQVDFTKCDHRGRTDAAIDQTATCRQTNAVCSHHFAKPQVAGTFQCDTVLTGHADATAVVQQFNIHIVDNLQRDARNRLRIRDQLSRFQIGTRGRVECVGCLMRDVNQFPASGIGKVLCVKIECLVFAEVRVPAVLTIAGFDQHRVACFDVDVTHIDCRVERRRNARPKR